MKKPNLAEDNVPPYCFSQVFHTAGLPIGIIPIAPTSLTAPSEVRK
jgi:hypothetical protein